MRMGDGMDLTNNAGREAGVYQCERRHEAARDALADKKLDPLELEEEIMEAADELLELDALEAVKISKLAAAEVVGLGLGMVIEHSHDYSSISSGCSEDACHSLPCCTLFSTV